MEIVAFADADAQMQALAVQVAGDLKACLAKKERVSLAVPGGTTPAPFFAALRQIDLAWSDVDILLTDERFVPETSDRSNARLIREHLLQDKAAAASFVPTFQAAAEPEEALDRITSRIAPFVPPDICVLGMGTDGHIASIFPGADKLQEALSEQAPPVLALRAPGADEARLTLTAPVLQASGKMYLLIKGAEKRAVLAQAARHGRPQDLPVRVVLTAQTALKVYYSE